MSKLNLSIKLKYLMLNVYRVFLYVFNFASDAWHKTYNFFKFVHLNALFVQRLKSYDVNVIPEINKLKTKTFGDWFEQLECQPKQALLSIALDPKSAGYKTKQPKFAGAVKRQGASVKLKGALSKVDAQIQEIKNLDEQVKKENAAAATRMAESKTDVKTRITNKINSDHQMSPEVKAQLLKQIEEAWMMEPRDL